MLSLFKLRFQHIYLLLFEVQNVSLPVQFSLYLHQSHLQILRSYLKSPQRLYFRIPCPDHFIQPSDLDIHSRLIAKLRFRSRALNAVLIAFLLLPFKSLVDSFQLLPQFTDFAIQLLNGPVASPGFV